MLFPSYFVLLLLCTSAVLDPSNWLIKFAEANFSVPSIVSCGGALLCRGAVLSDAQGNIWITPAADIPAQATTQTGMALYNEPIQMTYGSKFTSFTSSFTFEIHPKNLYIVNNTQYISAGDGMAFIMVADKSWVGSPGRSLGVYNDAAQAGPKTLAIEFDTFQNSELLDIDHNHVGIDIESAFSKVSRSIIDLGVKLDYGVAFYVWVDYDADVQNMEVRLNLNSSRPSNPYLQYSLKLSDAVAEFMWVGFSAANSNAGYSGFGRYFIYNWSFETFGLPNQTSPAAGPGQGPNSSSSLIPSPAGSRPRSSWMLVAFELAFILTFLMSMVLCFMIFFMKRNQKFRQLSDSEIRAGGSKQGLDLRLLGNQGTFKYKQLSEATGGFCEKAKLGQGGFGSVYRGVLGGVGNGMLVAVKRVHNESKQGVREFISEVSIISQLRHRNVVQLLGWSNDNGRFLLVYEFMPNGSLEKALFGTYRHSDDKTTSIVPDLVLSWHQRMNIISGVAKALHYLHDEWRQQVIHRDVKSSNIMLDDQFNAMLGDFGLARLVNHKQNSVTTSVAGTYGYMAPEIVVTRKYTEKTDTFAYGVVALEIASGRRACDKSDDLGPFVLVDWVWDCLSQDKLMTVVDPRLEGNFNDREMETVLLTGLLCTHPNPAQRPSMQKVIQVLAGHVPVPEVPASKPAPMYVSDLPNAGYSHY